MKKNSLKEDLYDALKQFTDKADMVKKIHEDENVSVSQLKLVSNILMSDVKFLVSMYKELLENKNLYRGLVENEKV